MSGQPGHRTPRKLMGTAFRCREFLRLGPASTNELHLRIGVGEATVRRALTWLRDLGAPLECGRGTGAVWRMTSPWELPVFRINKSGDIVVALDSGPAS